MRRDRSWKLMTVTSAILALMVTIALVWQSVAAEPTVTVYKSPT